MQNDPKYPKYGIFVEAEGELARHLRFLAVAVSDDTTRYFMCDIEVEEMEPATEERKYPLLRGIATDGRRLHIVEPLSASASVIHGMTPGRYHVVSVKGKYVQLAKFAEAPGAFPNWRKVVPEGLPKYETTFECFSLSGRHAGSSSAALAKMLRAFPAPTGINLKYLADLGQDDEWKVGWYGANRAIDFTSGPKRAVIMPMCMDE